MTIYSIYTFTNLVNGKQYVGQTIQEPIKRKNGHLKSSKDGAKCAFHNSVRKHGIDKFDFVVIDQSATNPEELNNLEILYILQFNTCILDENHNGYNMTRGGEGIGSERAKLNAALAIANGTSNMTSEKVKARNESRVKAGTHSFQEINGVSVASIRRDNGTNTLTGENGKKLQAIRIANGSHNFFGDAGTKLSQERTATQFSSGSHNFQKDGWLGAKAKKAIEKGTHASCIKRTCPHCGKEGKGGSMIRFHFENCKTR